MRRRDATTALALLTVGLLAGEVSVYAAAAEDRAPREIFLSETRLDTLKRLIRERIEPTNAAIAGALLGAVHGRDSIPPQWLRSILSCRPLPKSGTSHPRPVEFWPVDALRLAERLLVLGLHAQCPTHGDHQPGGVTTMRM